MIKQLIILTTPPEYITVGSTFGDSNIDKIVQENSSTFKIVGEDGKHLGEISVQNYYLIYF